jgi:hypothetical protein
MVARTALLRTDLVFDYFELMTGIGRESHRYLRYAASSKHLYTRPAVRLERSAENTT